MELEGAVERPGAQALVKKANAMSIKSRAVNFFMKLPPLCCGPQLRTWVERALLLLPKAIVA